VEGRCCIDWGTLHSAVFVEGSLLAGTDHHQEEDRVGEEVQSQVHSWVQMLCSEVQELIGNPDLVEGNLGTVHDCLNNLLEAAGNLDFDTLDFGILLDFDNPGSDFDSPGFDSPDSDSLLGAGNPHDYILDLDFGTRQEFLLYYDIPGSLLAD